MLDWSQIKTVLLDMDGTLLDLHFDNHFWLEFVPKVYAEKNNLTIEQSRAYLEQSCEQVQGKLQWYCLDYWNEHLQLDMVQLKRELSHLIQMRADTIPFLDALKASGRRVLLLTNAHPASLALKVEKTCLDQHIDELISCHTYGQPKEHPELWRQVCQQYQIDPAQTLFVDDSWSVLESAKAFGIGQLLAVANPDSKKPAREVSGYQSVGDFTTLLPAIEQSPL